MIILSTGAKPTYPSVTTASQAGPTLDREILREDSLLTRTLNSRITTYISHLLTRALYFVAVDAGATYLNSSSASRRPHKRSELVLTRIRESGLPRLLSLRHLHS